VSTEDRTDNHTTPSIVVACFFFPLPELFVSRNYVAGYVRGSYQNNAMFLVHRCQQHLHASCCPHRQVYILRISRPYVRYQSVGYGAEDRGRPRDPPKVSEPYGFGVPPLKTHLRVKRQHVTSTAWRVRGSGRPRPQGKRTNRTRFGRSTYTAGATRDQICDN
jgi:hypothetical protein